MSQRLVWYHSTTNAKICSNRSRRQGVGSRFALSAQAYTNEEDTHRVAFNIYSIILFKWSYLRMKQAVSQTSKSVSDRLPLSVANVWDNGCALRRMRLNLKSGTTRLSWIGSLHYSINLFRFPPDGRTTCKGLPSPLMYLPYPILLQIRFPSDTL